MNDEQNHTPSHIIKCSFCGRWDDEVDRMIAGRYDGAICSDCVHVYYPDPPTDTLFRPKKKKKKKRDETFLDKVKRLFAPLSNSYMPGPHCSFCGKHHENVQNLMIGAFGGNICDSCAEISANIILRRIVYDTPDKNQAKS